MKKRVYHNQERKTKQKEYLMKMDDWMNQHDQQDCNDIDANNLAYIEF